MRTTKRVGVTIIVLVALLLLVVVYIATVQPLPDFTPIGTAGFEPATS